MILSTERLAKAVAYLNDFTSAEGCSFTISSTMNVPCAYAVSSSSENQLSPEHFREAVILAYARFLKLRPLCTSFFAINHNPGQLRRTRATTVSLWL